MVGEVEGSSTVDVEGLELLVVEIMVVIGLVIMGLGVMTDDGGTRAKTEEVE